MRVAMARPFPVSAQLAEARRPKSGPELSGGVADPSEAARAAVASEDAIARTKEARDAELDKAIEWLNSTAESLPSEVRFSIHQATHQIVVRVVDGKGNVIREVPPERVLDAYATMAKLFGLMVDQSA